MSGINYPIYLDYHSTTPVDTYVIDAMEPYFTGRFGNPASNHFFGLEAKTAVETARDSLANSIGAKPSEIIYTSGATEAINLAIKGAAIANRGRGRHFVTVSTEHKAVLDCYDWLKKNGFTTTVLPVDSDGMLDPDQVSKAIRNDTVLVAVMAANNEIGVLQPLKEIGSICRANDVYFMTDATQALGKIPLDVNSMHVDLLAASAHKVYGPKGVGMLFARRGNPRAKLEPLIHGGGHEKGFRSGTLPVPLIAGFRAAVELSCQNMASEQARITKLRDNLQKGLLASFPDSIVHGNHSKRVSGNLSISFNGIDAEALLVSFSREIAVSTGSACTSEKVEPSHVLKALGLSTEIGASTVRFSLGRFTTETEIEHALKVIIENVSRLRKFGGN